MGEGIQLQGHDGPIPVPVWDRGCYVYRLHDEWSCRSAWGGEFGAVRSLQKVHDWRKISDSTASM